MRQHPLLRWIEQAEARRAEQFLNERALMTRPEPEIKAVVRTGPPRLLSLPWWRKLRTFRAANDLC